MDFPYGLLDDAKAEELLGATFSNTLL